MAYTYEDVLKKHGPLISVFRQKIALNEKDNEKEQHLYLLEIGQMILKKIEENELERDEAEKIYTLMTCDAEVLIDYFLNSIRKDDELEIYLTSYSDYTGLRHLKDQEFLDSELYKISWVEQRVQESKESN